MLAVGDHQCPIITWRWSELSVGLPRLIFISFFLCVCVFGQECIGASALFFLPCSHFPEQWITLTWGAAKHMSGSHAFGSSFCADRSLLMPAESMVIGSECGNATHGNHRAAYCYCILLTGAWEFTGNLKRESTCLPVLHLNVGPKHGIRNISN